MEKRIWGFARLTDSYDRFGRTGEQTGAREMTFLPPTAAGLHGAKMMDQMPLPSPLSCGKGSPPVCAPLGRWACRRQLLSNAATCPSVGLPSVPASRSCLQLRP